MLLFPELRRKAFTISMVQGLVKEKEYSLPYQCEIISSAVQTFSEVKFAYLDREATVLVFTQVC